jgi:hypothetical protein
MYAPPRTVRLVSAALAAFIGATLLLGKAYFNDEFIRLTAGSGFVTLPTAEVIGERPSRLAATPGDSRAN